jgi:hypothetical protein
MRAPGRSNLVPTISMAKSSVKGRGKGFTRENPLKIREKTTRKQMRNKKKPLPAEWATGAAGAATRLSAVTADRSDAN